MPEFKKVEIVAIEREIATVQIKGIVAKFKSLQFGEFKSHYEFFAGHVAQRFQAAPAANAVVPAEMRILYRHYYGGARDVYPQIGRFSLALSLF